MISFKAVWRVDIAKEGGKKVLLFGAMHLTLFCRTYTYADGSYLQGMWKHDVLVGLGKSVDEDGDCVTGVWTNGQLSGCVTESSVRGTWIGEWKDDDKNGKGIHYFYDGSSLSGIWQQGQLQGEAEFVFPDGKCTLKGQWQNDEMVCAHFNNDTSEHFSHDTHGFPGLKPLVRDPYEAMYTTCGPSTIEGAHEGLFAKQDLPAQLIVCHYNGVVLAHDVVDNRSWRYNANTMSLDEDNSIDVPKPYDSLTHYCATLGHKANHCKAKVNATYTDAYHPRFGHIRAIKTKRLIKAGEEIFMDYEYQHSKPPWYTD